MNIHLKSRVYGYALVCVFSLLSIFAQDIVAQTTPETADRLQEAFNQLASNDPIKISLGHQRLAVVGRVDPTVPDRLAAMMWDLEVNEASRYWALRTLVEIGPAAKGVMPDLVKAMQHSDPYFRLRASLAVLRAGGAPAEPVAELQALARQQSDPMVRGEAIMALGEAGPVAKDALPFLHQVAETSSDEWSRELATQALGGMGVEAKQSIPLLKKLLEEDSGNLRLAAVRALAQLVPTCPESVAPLIQSMRQPGYEGHAAADALIGAGSQIVPELVQLLQSEDTTVQSNAIHTLRFMGRSAAPALEELAELFPQLAEDSVRSKAVAALGNIGPTAVPQLVELFKPVDGTNVANTFAFCEAIGEMGEQATDAVPVLIQIMAGNDEYDRSRATDALIAIGSGAVNYTLQLIDLIDDENNDIDLNAIRVLGAIGPEAKDAVKTLLEVIEQSRDNDSNRSEKKARLAAVALSKMGVSDESVLSLLSRIFAGKPTESIESLGRLGPKAARVLPELRQLFSSKDSEVRIESALAVSRIDPAATDVVAVFVKSLTDPQGDYPEGERANAIRALMEIGVRAQEALKPLRALLDHETEVSAMAALAIYRIQPGDQEALESLILTLESGDSFAPSKAIQALGEIGPEAKAALPKLRQMAFFEQGYFARDEARTAIRAINPSQEQ